MIRPLHVVHLDTNKTWRAVNSSFFGWLGSWKKGDTVPGWRVARVRHCTKKRGTTALPFFRFVQKMTEGYENFYRNLLSGDA